MKLGCLLSAFLICQEVPSGVIFREAGKKPDVERVLKEPI
jgi:hypothetical protein